MWIKAKFDVKIYSVEDFRGYLDGIRKFENLDRGLGVSQHPFFCWMFYLVVFYLFLDRLSLVKQFCLYHPLPLDVPLSRSIKFYLPSKKKTCIRTDATTVWIGYAEISCVCSYIIIISSISHIVRGGIAAYSLCLNPHLINLNQSCLKSKTISLI